MAFVTLVEPPGVDGPFCDALSLESRGPMPEKRDSGTGREYTERVGLKAREEKQCGVRNDE